MLAFESSFDVSREFLFDLRGFQKRLSPTIVPSRIKGAALDLTVTSGCIGF